MKKSGCESRSSAVFCLQRSLILGLLLGSSASLADEAVAEIQYGQFELTHQPAKFLDQETIDSVSHFIDVEADVTWKLYVPESYDPDKPAGLMVYISPTQKGWIPRKWQPVFDDANMIWISANESGNEVVVGKRMIYAVLAPQIATRKYKIDEDRIYLSGFSGGGKVSGMVAINFANLFRGALYICGAQYWNEDPPRHFANVEQNRYVFLTGTQDFNRDLTYKIFFKYEEAGLENIEVINVPRMAHANPNATYFRKALEFLDRRE